MDYRALKFADRGAMLVVQACARRSPNHNSMFLTLISVPALIAKHVLHGA